MKKSICSLALAGAMLGAGCGGGAQSASSTERALAEAAENTLVVEIRNNWIPATTVTAFVKPFAGRRRLLGTVLSNETQTFTVPGRDVAGGYTLIAERRAGVEIESRRINEGGGYKTFWNLATNIVRTERIER